MAGDRDALLLSAGELRAALADDRLVAVLLDRDEVVCIGERGGAHDLVDVRLVLAYIWEGPGACTEYMH
jgi:hypothetical protein